MRRNLGIFFSYISVAVTMVTGLVLSSFLLKTLGDVEYGLYQTISSFANYLVLLEFGTGTVMTRNISVCMSKSDDLNRKENINKNYSTVFFISIVLSVLIFVVSMFFYFFIGNIYANTMTEQQIAHAKNIFIFLTLYIIVYYLTQSCNGFLMGVEEYSFAKIMSIIRVVLRTLVLILIISFYQSAIVIAVADMILGTTVFLVTFFYCKQKYKVKISHKYFDKSIFKLSIPLCLALLLQTITSQANSNVDKFVIGIMMSMESVTIYSVAQYVYQMFSTAVTIPASMYMPEVSKNIEKGLTGKEFTKTLIQPCRLTALIGGTIMCGFFAVGKQFISILYGGDKQIAWIYALIIIVPTFVYMTNIVINCVLELKNKMLVRSLTMVGTTVANIILTVISINKFGIIGAVVATALTLIIGNIIVLNIYYQKSLNIKIMYLFYQSYKGILLFQILSAVAAYFVAQMLSNDILAFCVGAGIYLVLSFGLIIAFGLNDYEKQKFKSAIAKFKKKTK